MNLENQGLKHTPSVQKTFVILDFGSQFTQLITRRFRELGYYSVIIPHNSSLETIRSHHPHGIILSGGPNSVYDVDSPRCDVKALIAIAPVLGVCYGMQLIAHDLGGRVAPGAMREYGKTKVIWKEVWGKYPPEQICWMSHGDLVEVPPVGFDIVARSEDGHPAAMRGPKAWAVQFHPEVMHTEKGIEILKAFAEKLCQARPDWSGPQMLEHLTEEIKKKVSDQGHILCGLSGGVDSTVVATVLTKIFGRDRVHCIFVDNGLLRKNEYQTVLTNYDRLGLNVKGYDAREKFLSQLKGVTDPEQKRKTIGRVFIEVFEEATKDLPPIEFLAQGTLYPDVIESTSVVGGASMIKSHHNVGGLPEKMNMKLLEPVRDLFKDEVRVLGRDIGIPGDLLERHPFPGPGLAIRIMGEVTAEKLNILREADEVYVSYLKEKNIYQDIWQAFCILTNSSTVGVQGDARSYSSVLALRAVTSVDGMTADWYKFNWEMLAEVSNRITNRVKGINRVVYDITSKPPGTIEWE